MRFGLLAGAVGLLVFLILFQQALLSWSTNQFYRLPRTWSARCCLQRPGSQKNIDGSIIPP